MHRFWLEAAYPYCALEAVTNSLKQRVPTPRLPVLKVNGMCALKRDRPARLTRDEAETVAIRALGFLADDPRRLTRFLSLTGMEPATLMAGAETSTVQTAVLDYLLTDESLLMVFSGHAALAPDVVPAARALLARDADG